MQKCMQENAFLLKYALIYHKLGFAVIPVKGKVPVVKWRKYQSKGVTKDEIVEWFTSFNDVTGIAVITGKVSNIIVIDVDGEKIPSWLKDIQTWKARTRRGYHFYFQYDIDELVNSFRIKSYKIDVKAEKGIVILPPSLHPEGGRYEWVSFKILKKPAPYSLIKPIIDELLEFELELELEFEEKNKKANLAKLYKGVPQGMRNESMTRIAGSLFADGLNRSEVYEVLNAVNQKNIPPLPEQEIWSIINSIEKRHIKSTEIVTSLLTYTKEFFNTHSEFVKFCKVFVKVINKYRQQINGNLNEEAFLKYIGKFLLPGLYKVFVELIRNTNTQN